MSPIRTLARPLLGALFVTGGYDALRAPAGRVDKVRRAGLASPEQLVRVNAATMMGAGLTLSLGRLPRLSALVLAGTLVPTTWVGHAFWAETDPAARKAQAVQFQKNLGMLGGLLLAVADTGGRESLPHAAGRVSRRARRRAARSAAVRPDGVGRRRLRPVRRGGPGSSRGRDRSGRGLLWRRPSGAGTESSW